MPKTPLLTVDIIIRMTDRPASPIVLVSRQNPPHGWALPGGFVDCGESVEAAALREAAEETCLNVSLIELLGCYSEPTRDPRFHTASLVFVANAVGEPKAADDAKEIRLVLPEQVPSLVFDHDRIVDDYRHYLKTGQTRAVGT
jgi:8-oxo-dGTP diphosphatase